MFIDSNQVKAAILSGLEYDDRYTDYRVMKPVMAHLWPKVFGNPESPLPFHRDKNKRIREYVIAYLGMNPMPRAIHNNVMRRVTNFLYIWTRRREYLASFEKHCMWHNLMGEPCDFIDFEYIEGRLDVLYLVRMRKDIDKAFDKLSKL